MTQKHNSNHVRTYLDWLSEKHYKEQPVDLNVIKIHVDKFKKGRTKRNFAAILKYTDKLVVYTILKIRNRRPHLQRVTTQELYQVGVVGVYDALQKMPVDVEADKIPSWITSYVKSHIRKNFYYLEKEYVNIEECYEHSFKNNQNDTVIYDYDLDILENLSVLTITEKNMLVQKFLHEKDRKQIAKMFHMSETTVTNNIKKALNKIRAFVKK